LRSEQRCLLLFLDLDGFKLINDSLGHAVGDQLLRHVGERLKNILRSSDTIARLGGDEFVILAGSANPDYAAQLAQKILEQLRLPILVASQSISISGSLGIAIFPDNGADTQQLMRAADMAMYTAKAEGRNRFISTPRTCRPGNRTDGCRARFAPRHRHKSPGASLPAAR
jgi:diguanylate cyclase (GGDEF)-like protein